MAENVPLTLYNTLTRRAETLAPLEAGHVRLYACGPTMYDVPHIGNARSAVVYDVLFRLLSYLFPHVTYVRNITDVDDKINAAAREQGISIQSLTRSITDKFHEDTGALNVLRPTIEPRATEHIAEMIRMIETLIEKGHAYVAEGHALFSVASDADYGVLSGRTQEEQKAGARVEVESYKRHPGDFVLWKPAAAGDDASSVFDSPWGRGRPGWHIECSAMSVKHLGATFDIHGGGADLMFPHHENEIAQSRCATGEAFAKLWVHNGFLTVNGEKMSKSLGNFITVRDLLARGVKGETIRYAMLKTKYREPLDWSDKLVQDARRELDGFYRKLAASHGADTGTLPKEFLAFLCDDMNVPGALSVLHQTQDAGAIKAMGALLGILQQDPESWFKGDADEDTAWIDAAIAARKDARSAKNFAESDRIRKELEEKGILLEDKPGGVTEWRRE